MADAIVIQGIDRPEAKDFEVAVAATTARAVARKSWFTPDFWIYCICLPAVILLAGLWTIDLVIESPGWRLTVIEDPSRCVRRAFEAGFIAALLIPLLSLPIEAVRKHLRAPTDMMRDSRSEAHSFTATSEILESEGPHTVTRWKWSAFDDVTRHDGAIILWRYDQLRYFVPSRAFASSDDADVFFNLAQQGIAKAFPSSPGP